MDQGDVQRAFPAICTNPYVEYDPEIGETIDKHDEAPFYALHEVGCGYMDPSACLNDLFRACEQIGVTVRFNTDVKHLDVSKGSVHGMVTAGWRGHRGAFGGQVHGPLVRTVGIARRPSAPAR